MNPTNDVFNFGRIKYADTQLIWTSTYLSEWLLFNAYLAICQLYHGENMLHVDEMVMMSALY